MAIGPGSEPQQFHELTPKQQNIKYLLKFHDEWIVTDIAICADAAPSYVPHIQDARSDVDVPDDVRSNVQKRIYYTLEKRIRDGDRHSEKLKEYRDEVAEVIHL